MLKITPEIIICLISLMESINNLFQMWQFVKRKRWQNRKWLVRPINKKRLTHGHYVTMFKELKRDPKMFFSYTRMDVETFKLLVFLIEPHVQIIKKRKDIINVEQRLVMTLRYLATGDDIASIALSYRIGISTLYKIVQQTCSVIYEVLSSIYLNPPNKTVWRNIAKGFWSDWNLPNCIGAIDGKHIAIQAPANSGSVYFNYKKFNSIVLLASCNHRYEFTVVDVGAFGGESDGGIFTRSEFGKALQEGSLNIPKENPPLPGTNIKMPYFFVGDEAFRMSNNLMRPYPGRHLSSDKRIFNYRLSRARRCIESTFGILRSRWRVFTKPIAMEPAVVSRIVLACVCLHNFLMARTQKDVRQLYCSDDFLNTLDSNADFNYDEHTRDLSSNTAAVHNMRDTIAKYFLSPEGEISWQYEYINRGRHKDFQEEEKEE